MVKKQNYLLNSFWIFLLFYTFPLHAFLHTQGTDIVDSTGQAIILRGLGLGAWLVQEGYQLHVPGYGSPSDIEKKILDLIGEEAKEEFYQKYIQNYVTEQDIQRIAEWGFNSIRLPFHYRMFEPEGQAGIRPEDPFVFLDRILGWCKKYRLYLILDMHCAPGGQNKDNISDSDGKEARLWTDPAMQKKTVEIWQKIAAHYANEIWIGGYDLLNEPVLPSGHSSSELRALYIRIAKAIREVDPNHILFIEGNWYATDFSGLTPPFDDNLVYAFHKYWNETSQGSISNYLNLRNQTGRPIWLGESGENSNVWFSEVIRVLESLRIGWNWWTHKKIETLTSPYSVPISSAYQTILNYWETGGIKPSPSFAKSTLMDLAEILRLEHCKFRPDVVDALIREPLEPKGKTLPFQLHAIPGVIPAVEYDLGGNGVAYSDKVVKNTTGSPTSATYWNSGGEYRNDGVDIESSLHSEIPYNVGWIESGEWLKYTVHVTTSGKYRVIFWTSALSKGGTIQLWVDGNAKGSVFTPVTGAWKKWGSVSLSEIELLAGEHVLKIEAVQGGFNLLSIEFQLDSAYVPEGQTLEPVNSGLWWGQNFPSPFSDCTQIPVFVSTLQHIQLEILNILGEHILTLYDGNCSPGFLSIPWNGENETGHKVAAGFYVCRIRAKGSQKIKKLIFLGR